MPASPRAPIRSLYVHVPFCAHKCDYCAFYSEVSDGSRMQRYTAALVRELELTASELRLDTVFFGGGTPSLLNLEQWERILTTFERLGLLGAREWTVECNPATVSLDKARLWRRFGINRVSLGVQSLDEHLLDRLGRVHSRDMVFKSFDLLRRGGFENINVDLMFAIPGQTLEVWRATLNEALALGSEHLSCYEVTYEEDTPLYAQLKAGRFDVDEDLACAMYDELVSRSGEHGFHQYEVANFARHQGTPPADTAADFLPSRACRHNVNYWRGWDYHGLGPSAAGYVRGVRTRNWADTRLYCEHLERGQRAIASTEALSPLGRAGEIAAFGLRMPAGWPFATFAAVTGFDLRNEWRESMAALVSRGWAVQDDHHFALTPTGLRFADDAGAEFLR
ncbi:MAG TPA: radical SAM family heme chaperone HemW [Methylomirabilota bacterium]|nr:radical SAM family heme chaperone HemW [Methylomirabilota bacterium]